ncbi:HTH-type transcriptional regulator YhaJ [Pseudoalteromonas holothuriae]|uniref:HTH-type transcriptional regulator YhaJ n=1 Tax=Pseudoalteromonas holothuriae TaxID=2963714 RepID=A0A9W4QU90_9GAMM|nr:MULTISPECIES: LysR family transcriptional regulator [unclassified Pseudoalteromonas]CAH9053357.1 HTH-type transcriptional regulator YhaJ [Pseudoalteromonas sp. CIP111854]CAH9061428.1 HTH-type transcriptional regulator YhaJ [Pseudoalteromonas sp. CIP111951]
MLRITLEQWRMFRMVAEHGGFNQAAEQIHKSQSSIHTAVSKIEQLLGVKVFYVEGRKTKLTDSGEMLLRRANYLLDEAQKVEAVGYTLGAGVEASLRIAVDEVFDKNILYQALEATSKSYPLLRIELFESILSGAHELVESNQADVAISPISLANGVSEQLCTIDFVAVSSPFHPLQQLNRQLELEDLKSFRQIVIRDSAYHKRSDSGWLEAEQRWTVSHLRTSIDVISQGLGFAWLPLSAIASELESAKLVRLPLTYSAIRTSSLFLVFQDGDRLGIAAQMFIERLRDLCRNGA